MQTANSLEKILMLGKTEKGVTCWLDSNRWVDSNTGSMVMNLSKLQERVEERGAWHAAVMESQRVGHNLVTEQ